MKNKFIKTNNGWLTVSNKIEFFIEFNIECCEKRSVSQIFAIFFKIMFIWEITNIFNIRCPSTSVICLILGSEWFGDINNFDEMYIEIIRESDSLIVCIEESAYIEFLYPITFLALNECKNIENFKMFIVTFILIPHSSSPSLRVLTHHLHAHLYFHQQYIYFSLCQIK
jgi:hypothetical protein